MLTKKDREWIQKQSYDTSRWHKGCLEAQLESVYRKVKDKEEYVQKKFEALEKLLELMIDWQSAFEEHLGIKVIQYSESGTRVEKAEEKEEASEG